MKLSAITEGSSNKFFAYRLGKSPEKLAERNAGTIGGVVDFLWIGTKRKYKPNKILTKYEITNLSGKFSDYKPKVMATFDEKKGRLADHIPDEFGPNVGMADHEGEIWYSFPVNGAWRSRIVKSVRLSDINALFVKETGDDLSSLYSMTRDQRFSLESIIKEVFK